MDNRSRRRALVTGALAVIVLGAGALGTWTLLVTGPEVATEDKAPAPRRVRVLAIQPRAVDVTVRAYGTVVPHRQAVIRPEVAGQVVRVHPKLTVGGLVGEGEELLAIEKTDYELALRQRRAELTEAKVEIALEGGRRAVAEREWKAFTNDLDSGLRDSGLALREPQRDLVRARLYGARARVDQARANLDRTTVEVPFAAMVMEEAVEQGTRVDPSSAVCRLVGTDEFWIEAALPVSELQRSGLHRRENAPATVRLELGAGHGVAWQGHVVRLVGALSEQARTARVIVAVPDPLGLKDPEDARKLPLLLGSYVSVEIDAGRLERVVEIPRTAVREDDKIWVVDHEDKLQILDAEIVWRRPDTVLIRDNLSRDHRLVVSDLRVALPGMAVAPESVEPAPKPVGG